jgi:hypothetical protein
MMRDKRNVEAMWRGACTYLLDRAGALAAARAGDTRATTIKINGGTTGLSDRQICVARAAKAMGGVAIAVHGHGISTGPVPAPVPPPPAGTGTPVVVHPDPGDAKTTVEVEESERSKRNKAAGAGTTATVGSGPAASGGETPKTNIDWLIIGGVMLVVAIIAAVVVRHFAQRHAEARAAVEAQQLALIKQRVETATT